MQGLVYSPNSVVRGNTLRGSCDTGARGLMLSWYSFLCMTPYTGSSQEPSKPCSRFLQSSGLISGLFSCAVVLMGFGVSYGFESLRFDGSLRFDRFCLRVWSWDFSLRVRVLGQGTIAKAATSPVSDGHKSTRSSSRRFCMT